MQTAPNQIQVADPSGDEVDTPPLQVVFHPGDALVIAEFKLIQVNERVDGIGARRIHHQRTLKCSTRLGVAARKLPAHLAHQLWTTINKNK
jgi:hypothetical protein